MVPVIAKLCSLWTSRDVSCSSQLHNAGSIIWEFKHIWIVQCFHGLVGLVIHEQGAWSPPMYWAPQQKETIAAWGVVGAAGELICNSSWSPQLPQSAVLPHICRCYKHCKVGLHSDLAKLPQSPGCKASVQSILNSLCAPGCFSGLINVSKPHTLLLPPPNLHFLSLSSPFCFSL